MNEDTDPPDPGGGSWASVVNPPSPAAFTCIRTTDPVDDAIKKEICFGETLIISCGHYDGDIYGEELDSEWSCTDTTSSASSEEIKKDDLFEVKDRVEEESEPEPEEEEDNFRIYFFPDCKNPPPPKHSRESFMMVDGLPKLIPKSKQRALCTCLLDTKGRCDCYTKLPCLCGARVTAECTCPKLNTVCICDESKPPKPVCTCKPDKVCVCFPGYPQPVCKCRKVEKPCICYERAGKVPNPICVCKRKPKYSDKLDVWTGQFLPIEEEIVEQTVEEGTEQTLEEKSKGGEEETNEEQQNEELTEEQLKEDDTCTCQLVPKKPKCLCLKGNKCICLSDSCICGVQKTCVCEPSPSDPNVCKSDESNKIICECEQKAKTCLCEGSRMDCRCFFKPPACTCGDPENCKCYITCDCTEPCVCDVVAKAATECTCLDNTKSGEVVCTCEKLREKRDEIRKLKKVRAGKEGYRWCRDVDPRHTYFDYAYDRHDKISYKENPIEKVKILGLHDEKKEIEECLVHGIQAPPYKKTVRKPSLDCCSSVGGITICVETLGEDKDKFLVQVVSHSSKEGAKTGTKLVSILDCNLHTMEENRTEHISKQNLTKERKSYFAICQSGYYNKMTRNCGDKSVVKRNYHSFEDAKEFLLEGANVVLLRYFAISRYRGNVKTETVMMNGAICESIYVSNGVSQAIVNGKPLFVVKVERHIIEPSGVIHQTLTVLSLRGYMITHEWADNNYIFHINPLLNIIPERDEIEMHAPLRSRWREDMQLLSDYLDFKSTRTSEGGRYVRESGALTGTIRDYLQAVLLLRPQDALRFTRHYFGAALSALDLPHDEYFDSSSKHVRYYFLEE